MRFEQWAKNPTCEANTISAVRNVRMSDVAVAEGITPTFGQSPFAIARGDQFERSLFYREGELILDSLIQQDVLPAASTGLIDLRIKMNGGTRISTLDDSLEATRAFLRHVAAATTSQRRGDLPAVAAGPTLEIPRGVMLPEAVLIVDVLAIRVDQALPELIVGEVKTYPDRGGHTAAAELAVARAQAGIYVHALDVVCAELGLTNQLVIRRDGFLVLTRPGSNRPSVRAGEDLRYQAERARSGFELLEAAAEAMPKELWAATEIAPPEELVQAIQSANTTYNEACLAFCDRTSACHRDALANGDAVVLGDEAKRFLGDIGLDRLDELLNGDAPAGQAESDLLRRISESDKAAGP